jgi:hypothetical protein
MTTDPGTYSGAHHYHPVVRCELVLLPHSMPAHKSPGNFRLFPAAGIDPDPMETMSHARLDETERHA